MAACLREASTLGGEAYLRVNSCCGANSGASVFVALDHCQSRRSTNRLKHNGQRWCALAVQDYESRALPLSYGG